MMNWFSKHGDKVFAFVTALSALVSTQGLVNGDGLRWVAFAGAVATLAHQFFFPTQGGSKP